MYAFPGSNALQVVREKPGIPASILYSTNGDLDNIIAFNNNFLLIYKKLRKNAIHLRLNIDTSFQNLLASRSQIELCIYLAYRSNTVSKVHYHSSHASLRDNSAE